MLNGTPICYIGLTYSKWESYLLYRTPIMLNGTPICYIGLTYSKWESYLL